MHELHQQSSLQALFDGQEHHLAIQAVLAGVAQGKIFTDGGSSPGWAVLWVQHRVFVTGSPNEVTLAAVRDLLADEIAPAARARGDSAFGLYYPLTWSRYRAALLPRLPYSPSRRQYYLADQLSLISPVQGRLPAGLRLAAVDAALLEQTSLHNVDRLVEETCSERPTVQDFLQHSFGVCLLDGDTLAGWCLSEYNCGDRCEVGIEVVEEYQRRGLGALLTQALCEEAARRGVCQVGWHCLAHNVASGATARKAGLRLVQEYPAAVVWLK